MFQNPDDAVLKEILSKSRRIAVVGLSNKPERDSYRVARYMKEQGYEIIPVNPMIQEALGKRAYPELSAIPHPVDIVNVFRRAEEVPAIIEAVLQLNFQPVIWLQLGVVHQEAAEKARARGLTVVMDRCLMVEHRRLLGGSC
ncbi:CoA-binding protein [Desulfofundulus salinus]|uniref:CoA-binding protein n=1 Tax=Desulfofundulus salinus TaxID=2419843 RepID=A0A494X2C7_9FIRM|nr:CoA-binding protein [Desulfofundulus salinum]RKO66994.1 CoA-binding protein [Desulfofundulus salinum]